MVAVCEPQCTDFAHEINNAGFLLRLQQVYPQEKILFYGEIRHIHAIQYCFSESGNSQQHLEFLPVQIPPQRDSFRDVSSNYRFFDRLLGELQAKGIDCLFLLSAHASSLLALKILKATKYRNMKFVVLLHGLADYARHPLSWCLGKPRSARWIQHSRYTLLYRNTGFLYVALSFFSYQNMMADTLFRTLPLEWIYHPTILAKDTPILDNPTVRFATVGGSGNFQRLYTLDKMLTDSGHRNYTIHVLGKSLGDFPYSERVIPGAVSGRISRGAMSAYMEHIDVLLYLYDENQYTFAQSGAFYEIFQYTKPAVFLKNSNFSSHNAIAEHFGLEVESIAVMAAELGKLIGGDHKAVHRFLHFKNAIPKVKAEIDKKSLCKMHDIVNRVAAM